MSATRQTAGGAPVQERARPLGAAPRRRRRRRRINYVPFLFVLPALLAYALFAFLPLAHTAWLSLYEWDGITVGTWVGLDNYRDLIGDEQMRDAFSHSLQLVVFYAVIPTILGLVVAAFLARSVRRGMTMYRALIFLPQAIATVVSAVAWKWIYLEDGPISDSLRAVGLGSLVPDAGWLGEPDLALFAIGLVGSWIMIGLCTVLFMAGVQSIDRSLYDAARVDGAGPFREFFAVTVPGLRAEIAFALTITVIAALRSFDLVYVMTGGGPNNATKVPAVYLYQQAFQNGEVGSACAIAVMLTLLIFLAAAVIARFQTRSAR